MADSALQHACHPPSTSGLSSPSPMSPAPTDLSHLSHSTPPLWRPAFFFLEPQWQNDVLSNAVAFRGPSHTCPALNCRWGHECIAMGLGDVGQGQEDTAVRFHDMRCWQL